MSIRTIFSIKQFLYILRYINIFQNHRLYKKIAINELHLYFSRKHVKLYRMESIERIQNE